MLGRVLGRRDLELVLPSLGAAGLLGGVRDLVGEQVQAEGIVGLVAAVGEVDVVADGVRLGADGARGLGRVGAGVHAHAGQIGAERLLELALDPGGQGGTAAAAGPRDRGLGVGGHAVGVAGSVCGPVDHGARGHPLGHRALARHPTAARRRRGAGRVEVGVRQLGFHGDQTRASADVTARIAAAHLCQAFPIPSNRAPGRDRPARPVRGG